MKKKFNFLKSHTIELGLFIVIFTLLNVFLIDDYNAILLIVLGFLFIYFCIGKFRVRKTRQIFLQVIFSLIILFLFFYQPASLMAILLGVNLGAGFLQLRNLKLKSIDVSIINATILAGILLASGIEKFRGANKLSPLDIQITIPMIILIAILTYFFGKIIVLLSVKIKTIKYIAIQTSILSHVFFILISFVLVFIFYKEVGTDILIVPLICGALANVFNMYIKPKTILHDFIEIVLIFIIPFQVAGYLGVGIGAFGFVLCGAIISRQVVKYDFNNLTNFAKFIPIIFIFASQEIRENKGLIEKFDLTNGYQIGWIIISLILIGWINKHLFTLKKILLKNEIGNLYSYLGIIFIIILYAIVVKTGRFEATIALSVVSGALIFAKNTYKNLQSKANMRFLIVFSYIVGSISFLVLTTF